MGKNKYDFISELLEQKKLNPLQKEKFLKLVSQEFKNSYSTSDEIESRLKTIEKKLGMVVVEEIANEFDVDENNSNPLSLDSSSNKHIESDAGLAEKDVKNIIPSNSPTYFNPSSLYKFLFEYNQNTILKSTCHEIDSNALEVILEYCQTDSYDFSVHYAKILSAFKNHERLFAPKSIKALIRVYLTGQNFAGAEMHQGWSSDKIKVNWGNAKLALWSSNHHNLPPNSINNEFKKNKIKGIDLLEDAFTSKITGKRIQTFRELVLHFKSLFHIRDGEDSLFKILSTVNSKEKWNESIDFDLNEVNFPMNIELFTDVDKLIQAYNKIIELIIEQHVNDSRPNVRLGFYEEGHCVYLSIHHLNNTYNKTIQNTLERMGQTYTNLISKQINGLCNLYLIADFGKEGFAEINLWDGKDRIVNKEGLEDFIGGVEHIFQFCKI